MTILYIKDYKDFYKTFTSEISDKDTSIEYKDALKVIDYKSFKEMLDRCLTFEKKSIDVTQKYISISQEFKVYQDTANDYIGKLKKELDNIKRPEYRYELNSCIIERDRYKQYYEEVKNRYEELLSYLPKVPSNKQKGE